MSDMTDQEISALVPTLSPRPKVWYDLVRLLVSEGFVHKHETAEWIKGEVRGRICTQVNASRPYAWLRHHDNQQSHHIEGEHEL
jgi:hypothetical protein